MRLYLFCLLSCVPLLSAHAQETTPQPPVKATIGADGKQHVNILGGSYFFKPNHIIVKVNVPVELSVRLEPGMVPHTLVIQAPEAGMVIDSKLSSDTTVLTFTPTATGKYTFLCKNKLLFFKSHQDKGMHGILEVVP
ncbi:MAG: quinol oxidase [Pseudomonadota bacterium]